MFEYFRTLPQRPLPVRRRFVVIATAVSFLIILGVWALLAALGRGRLPESAPPLPEITPMVAPSPLPVGGPAADIEEVSSELEKFFGTPAPSLNSP